jgi:hypothetical protein
MFIAKTENFDKPVNAFTLAKTYTLSSHVNSGFRVLTKNAGAAPALTTLFFVRTLYRRES